MCDGRNHNLIVIYSTCDAWNEERVVRWCTDCGAVVVDRESDGRLFGKIVKMKFPKVTYDLIKRKKQGGNWSSSCSGRSIP